MARPGITFEEVQAAALDLLGRGANPSVQRVREALGTGSNSTIAAHLKRWQEEIHQSPKTALPPSVPESVLEALEHFWRIAIEQAENEFRAAKTAAEQSVIEAEQARQNALSDLESLRQEADGLSRALLDQQEARVRLEKQLIIEQERRSQAENLIEAAEQRARSALHTAEQLCAESAARIRELEDNLAHLREDAQNLRQEGERRVQHERQRAEASEIRLLRIIDQLRGEHAIERDALQNALARSQVRTTELEQQYRKSQEMLSANQAAYAAADARCAQLDAELSRTRSAQQQLEERFLRSTRLAETLRNKLKMAHARHQVLAKELDNRKQAELSNQNPEALSQETGDDR